jgi:hypothetical protein
VDGIKFASESESFYYLYCKERKAQGEIEDFRMQVPFTLQEGYINASGKKIRPIVYISDFIITSSDGRERVVDVKSSPRFMTEIFKLKKKIWEYKFKDILHIVIVKKKNKEYVIEELD